MRLVVTGGAGFIGSNLVDRLLERGDEVVAIDNFSTGEREFVHAASRRAGFELVELDLLRDPERIRDVVDGSDVVVHFAANADVRFGWDDPARDLSQNVIVTHHVLEAMRVTRARRIVFASTGSVYGEATVIPTPEDAPFPVQTSLYAASKLAGEGLVQAYAEGAGFRGTVLRMVSILGPRYTHGHVVDFLRKLRADDTVLEILGDGKQRKSYLDIADFVGAVEVVLGLDHQVEVFNVGTDESCTVDESASWICARLGIQPELRYMGGDRGWVGDNPCIVLATEKLRATGWAPRTSIRAGIERTVDYVLSEPWVLDRDDRR